jgi:predicted Zn-dependent protease
VIATGRLAVNLAAQTVSVDGKPVHLTTKEYGIIELLIDIVPMGQGDSVATLASGLPFGRYNEAWFRVLNGLSPGQSPRAGDPVKVVR